MRLRARHQKAQSFFPLGSVKRFGAGQACVGWHEPSRSTAVE